MYQHVPLLHHEKGKTKKQKCFYFRATVEALCGNNKCMCVHIIKNTSACWCVAGRNAHHLRLACWCANMLFYQNKTTVQVRLNVINSSGIYSCVKLWEINNGTRLRFAFWEKIQRYRLLCHQTTEQLFSSCCETPELICHTPPWKVQLCDWSLIISSGI